MVVKFAGCPATAGGLSSAIHNYTVCTVKMRTGAVSTGVLLVTADRQVVDQAGFKLEDERRVDGVGYPVLVHVGA